MVLILIASHFAAFAFGATCMAIGIAAGAMRRERKQVLAHVDRYDHTLTTKQAYLDGAFETNEDFERAMEASISQNDEEGHG